MTPERWQVVEELYHSASGLPDAQRESFLREACGKDAGLFREVDSLLIHGSAPQSILDTPAIAVVAKAIAADEYEFSTPLVEGQTISHYRIVSAIGRGGMGVVYKAEDLKLKRHAALKLLPQSLARDPQALQRFEREAQAASALNHPNICTVYEIDESDGLHFIAIELLDGKTLKERIGRGPLEIREILGIVEAICAALEAAHSAGIIHRDIKPPNIIVTRQGATKLLDFGVAKRLGSELPRPTEDLLSKLRNNADLRLTRPGAAVGTVAYMSPEQAGGQEVDTRSDLFSLGAVLYELTTRRSPFPGKDAADVLRAIQERTPTPIEQLRPETPYELIRITKRAMQRDRSLRYPNAAEMRGDLQTLRKRLEFGTSRRKALLLPLLIVLFFTAITAGFLQVKRVREWILGKSYASVPNQIKSVAVLPLENLTGDASQEYFADGMTEALITNLTKLSSLRVISRTSAMHYKGTHKALPEIARELNVNAVVEGTVARAGDRVRITAKLVDSSTDQNLWGRDYDRDVKDVLQLQNELAAAVAQEVAGKLTPHEQASLSHSKAVKPEVYEAYLKGRDFSKQFSEDGLRKALGYFQEAIRLDPNYAPAYAGLADAYSIFGFRLENQIDRPELMAIEAAKKALLLDDSLAEAHASLGFLFHRYMQDWTGAEKEYRRAIQLNPNYAAAHRFYGDFLRDIGQEDLGCAEFQLAYQLDPLNSPMVAGWARCLYESNHFDQAVQKLKDILEINPNSPRSLWMLGDIYERRGMFPQAIEQYQKGIRQTGGGSSIMYALLWSAYAGWGKMEEAERVHAEYTRRFGEDKWITAGIYARMGRKEEAIRDLLDDTSSCGPGTCGPGASLYVSQWRFDSLRSDPRFQSLLDKFHYPESAHRRQ